MIYFGSMFKLTENYFKLTFGSLYRVLITHDVNKPGFKHPET